MRLGPKPPNSCHAAATPGAPPKKNDQRARRSIAHAVLGIAGVKQMRFRLSGGGVAQGHVSQRARYTQGIRRREGDLLMSFRGRPIGNGRLRAGGRIEIKKLVRSVGGWRSAAVASTACGGCGRRSGGRGGGLSGRRRAGLLLRGGATAIAALTRSGRERPRITTTTNRICPFSPMSRIFRSSSWPGRLRRISSPMFSFRFHI